MVFKYTKEIFQILEVIFSIRPFIINLDIFNYWPRRFFIFWAFLFIEGIQ